MQNFIFLNIIGVANSWWLIAYSDFYFYIIVFLNLEKLIERLKRIFLKEEWTIQDDSQSISVVDENLEESAVVENNDIVVDKIEGKEDEEKKSWIQNVVQDKTSKIKNIVKNRFSFRLSDDRKQSIAENIINDSHIDKLYWCQLVVACMLATLWLLMNSIPVVIGSMLVSPILTPIKTFAFAIINWKKHVYINSLKILLLSILIAIPSSFLICYLVPFSSITEQVLLRATPTVVDWLVAILSWIIAFLFLWDEKMEESIVWIAIAVSLMPPLAAVWIWLHFMNRSVAQWSFLLFITNLVGILTVGILIFYLFGFRPTNRSGKKRTSVTVIMLIIFVWLITVPLRKSMTQIAETQKMNSLITQVSNDYFDSLNNEIVINELSFRNVSEGTVRIVSKLDVPAEFSFTNSYKEELTKRLSESLWKSVELDLDIVEISSVYIEKWEAPEKILLDKVNKYLSSNHIIMVDNKNLLPSSNFLFLNLYTDQYLDKEAIKDEILNIIEPEYSWAKLVLQWQDNLKKQEEEIIEKSQAEIDLEKQFSLLFRGWEVLNFDLDYLERVNDEEYEKYAQLMIEFKTPYSTYKTKEILSWWKDLVKEYLWMDVVMKVKFEEINLLEI